MLEFGGTPTTATSLSVSASYTNSEGGGDGVAAESMANSRDVGLLDSVADAKVWGPLESVGNSKWEGRWRESIERGDCACHMGEGNQATHKGGGELGKEMDISIGGKKFIRGKGKSILWGVVNSPWQGAWNRHFQSVWALGWLGSRKGGSLGLSLLGKETPLGLSPSAGWSIRSVTCYIRRLRVCKRLI